MANAIHLEEKIGKTVGRDRTDEDPWMAYRRIVANARLLRPRLPYPRGVFRFKTLEEAHEWQQKHMLAAATAAR
jgi:hypothetical protein